MAPLNTTMHHVDKTQPHDVSFDRDKSLMRIVETPGGFGPTVRDGSVIRVHLTVHTPNEEGDGERLVYDSATTNPSGLTLTVGFTDHVCTRPPNTLAPAQGTPSSPRRQPARLSTSISQCAPAERASPYVRLCLQPSHTRLRVRPISAAPSPPPHLRRPISAAPSPPRRVHRAVSTAPFPPRAFPATGRGA